MTKKGNDNPVYDLEERTFQFAKAVRLLAGRGFAGISIDDISHAVANILKHEYQKHPMFETFISACGRCSKKLKQTILACLVPPKVSTKARFMNLHRLVKWAGQLLKHSPKGRVSKGSIVSKLRIAIGQIPECRAFINRFLRDVNPLLESQKILKNNGLSHDSYKQCLKLMETIPPRSRVRNDFINWMKKQIMVAESLGLEHTGLPISSDNIESLFGVSKQHGCGVIKDANRIALRIPAMCGVLTRKEVQMVLGISVKEQQKIEASLPSLTKQRREILPTPGCLDKIIVEEAKKNIELLPRVKKRSKKSLKIDITDIYNKLDVCMTYGEIIKILLCNINSIYLYVRYHVLSLPRFDIPHSSVLQIHQITLILILNQAYHLLYLFHILEILEIKIYEKRSTIQIILDI